MVCVPYRAARARQVALVSPKEDALVDVTEQPTDGADRIMRNKITNNVVFVRTIAAGAKVEVPFRCGSRVAPEHGALANDAGSFALLHALCIAQQRAKHSAALRTAERATLPQLHNVVAQRQGSSSCLERSNRPLITASGAPQAAGGQGWSVNRSTPCWPTGAVTSQVNRKSGSLVRVWCCDCCLLPAV